MASMTSHSRAVPAVTRVASRRTRASASRLGGKSSRFGAHETSFRFSNFPQRGTNPRVAPSAVAGLFGRGAPSDAPSLAAIEAEIDAASPASSTAGTTQLSLADAVWKVSREIPLSLRDRAACAVAAEATQALCETGLDGAGLAVTLAILEALRRNDIIDGFTVDDDGVGQKARRPTAPQRFVKARAGYRAGDVSSDGMPSAVPHAWLEFDGRVLDVVTDGLALCEAARRASIDYSDLDAMKKRFGDDVLRVGGYRPAARPPLTVLNVPVPVGGTKTMTVPVRLTLTDPPVTVSNAETASAMVQRYREALRACADSDPARGETALNRLVDEMPLQVEAVFRRVASVKLDVVGDENARNQRLGL
jgi:hypothetical protein